MSAVQFAVFAAPVAAQERRATAGVTCQEVPIAHISQIATHWPLIEQAHGDDPEVIGAAQDAVLRRYRPAVYRYLLACVGSPDAAEDVWQDFALRFVRGDFRNANPEKGRFRDLLKAALYHLVVDHHKRRQRRMLQLCPEAAEPAAQLESTFNSDREFLAAWQADLLSQTWAALAEEEKKTGRPMHTVLRFRAEHEAMRSAQMAEALSGRLGKKVSAEWVRAWIHRARERFAELMLTEVKASLLEPTPDLVEQELMDLGLLKFCKSAVDKWRKSAGGK